MGRVDLVVGTGSGRCGTNSLAVLLDLQPGYAVTHERYKWRVPHDRASGWANRLYAEAARWEMNGHSRTTVGGDVSFYWIHAARSLMRYEGVRILCLKRNRKATIESFMWKTRDRDPWREGRGEEGRWDMCFPSYPEAESKPEAIGRYWDDTYARAEELALDFPRRFRIFPTESLNSVGGQHDILQFAGVPEGERKLLVGLKYNSRRAGV